MLKETLFIIYGIVDKKTHQAISIDYSLDIPTRKKMLFNEKSKWDITEYMKNQGGIDCFKLIYIENMIVSTYSDKEALRSRINKLRTEYNTIDPLYDESIKIVRAGTLSDLERREREYYQAYLKNNDSEDEEDNLDEEKLAQKQRNKELQREYKKKWIAAHPDYMKNYHDSHKDRSKSYYKEYYKNKKEERND